jgi:S1-C subfamily serine protease
VSRPVPGGPAEKAGLQKGDVISGVNGRQPSDLIDFYRQIRALGSAGVTVPLDVERDGTSRHFDIKSMSRRDHLKLNSTF